jgi:hypothetical protein
MFKGVSQYVPAVSLLYFGQFNPFQCSPLSLPSQPPLFNSVQYTSLCPLPAQMWCFMILLMLYNSLFLSLLPQVPQSISTVANVFYIWVCIWSCLFLCICLSFGSIFHVWEKTCGLCVSEPGLLHLPWCPPITSIYLQTALCLFSLWLNKTPLCVYIYILSIYLSPSFLIHLSVVGHLGWFHTDRDLVSVFCMWISSFLNTIFWRGCLFSNVGFWHLCQNQKVFWIYFWLFYYNPLVYVSVLACTMLFSSLCFCSIIWSQILWYLHCCFFLLRIELALWGLLCLYMNFRIDFFYFCEECHWNIVGNCIESMDWFL